MREGSNFIRDIVIEDIESGKHEFAITRFPPEPNGLLHIGHCKAMTINFDISKEFNGFTYLRFDDTNPAKEDERFVRLIKEDIKWMGFEWKELRYASDYFDEMYKRAHILIDKGLAYVDDISAEEMRQMRGTLTESGQESKNRYRPIEESRDLFNRMKAGEFPEGSLTLRAKIDMGHPNIIMRDPVIYRIVNEPHYRTGDEWHIYPMYDFAHPLEDYVERITHSLCSLEFENNRPLYDWYLDNSDVEYHPRQYEFAKLNIEGAIIGKRNILAMVEEGLIDGWDDPRLLTISGMRRRGYSPEGIKNFIRATGVSKENSVVRMDMLEHFIRDDLKLKTARTMAVLDPLKVVITNYEKEGEIVTMTNNVDNEDLGSREIPFSGEIYIEREDFSENPPKNYKRLSPGAEVRLMGAYFIKCEEVIKDDKGNILELRCTYDEETKSGSGFKGRKPQGTIHWVDAKTSIPARVYRFSPLIEGVFDSSVDLVDQVDRDSVQEFSARVERNLADAKNHQAFQFVRHGYFAKDETHPEILTYNETVSLKSSYRP
ncbi:MAG: glutamine--tRNA ligase/YqeY domain fusion protein [Tissierellia bacterium]|nr:glutamine--tRNA ligase/YqeY domain fusion protein [Tissierellia bacterium]